jgi:hypothetical protein
MFGRSDQTHIANLRAQLCPNVAPNHRNSPRKSVAPESAPFDGERLAVLAVVKAFVSAVELERNREFCQFLPDIMAFRSKARH